jgi:hypothetical protein
MSSDITLNNINNNNGSSGGAIDSGIDSATSLTSMQQTQQQQVATIADFNSFIQYLKQFVPILLDADYHSIGEFDKCLNEKTSVDAIKKFMSDPQIRSLMIQKLVTKGKFDSNKLILL